MDNEFIQLLPVDMVRCLVVDRGNGAPTLGQAEFILKSLRRYLRARMSPWERLVFLLVTRT